jgi:hypothetical protein
VLDQTCDIVKRHICRASADAVTIYTSASRDDLAAGVRASARQQFGCPNM